MKYLIYGGSFNPPHWGHITTAFHAKNVLDYNRLIFVPSKGVGKKKNQPSLDVRLKMLKSILHSRYHYDYITTSIEDTLNGYTYNTIMAIKEFFEPEELGLLIGTDQANFFTKWYKYKEIFDICNVHVMKRPSYEIKSELPFTYIDVPQIDISSTKLREMIENDEDIPTTWTTQGVVNIYKKEVINNE